MNEVKIGDLVSESFSLTKDNFLDVLKLGIIAFVITAVAVVATFGIGVLVVPLIASGYLLALVKLIRDKQKPEIGDLFSQTSNYVPCLLLALLFLVPPLALGFIGGDSAIIGFLSSFLNLLAGVLVSVGFLLICDSGMSMGEAKDWLIDFTKENFGQVVVVGIVNYVLVFIGGLLLLVGLVFFLPMTYVLLASYYLKIKQ